MNRAWLWVFLTLFLLYYIHLPVTSISYPISDPEPQPFPALQSEYIGVDLVCVRGYVGH